MRNNVSWDDLKMLVGFGTVLAGMIYFAATMSTKQDSFTENQRRFEERLNTFGTEQVAQGKDIAIIKQALKAQGVVSKDSPEESTFSEIITPILAIQPTLVPRGEGQEEVVHQTTVVVEEKGADNSNESSSPTPTPTVAITPTATPSPAPTPIVCIIGICLSRN